MNKELQEQIDTEAKAEAKKLTGRVPIFRMGYESGYYDGAEKYAEKLQAAEAKIEWYEKALKDFANRLNETCGQNGIITAGLHFIIDEMLTFELLTPKTGNDE